ncbi:hypothetical protein EDC18_101461 [Natranaerovirga pectinivora]|uniref:Uncharacterized protein n=1 Tax=Natranaerovirga pectinivora TaxID=682400 RepID=A0A4R3MRM4_9FIRM|nr:hypothetical protein [Natranaerovirga pectinivora]TCT17163.1 hypothetical protein EDC18_101461 [Natranaerovirga pectinivora]
MSYIDFLLMLLYLTLLPLGVLGILYVDVIITTMNKVYEKFNLFNVPLQPYWWSKTVYLIMSLISILIGTVALLSVVLYFI